MSPAQATIEVGYIIYHNARGRSRYFPRFAPWVAQDMIRLRHESKDYRVMARAAIQAVRNLTR